MKVIAVLSTAGGAGSTTVAAHLSLALHLQKRDALAFDFCSDNLLRLHLGMDWHDTDGFAAALTAEKDWHGAAYRSSSGLDFLPFGELPSEHALEKLCAWFDARPGWFGHALSTLQLAPETVVVCDCPRAPAALREQVLAAADLVLLVAAPDTVSYACATRIASETGALGGPPAMIVLNGFDPARRLDRDISVLLRTQHKQALSPVVIHRDEAVREALACKQTVFGFAPSSQAAYDFSALATWALARLGHGDQA